MAEVPSAHTDTQWVRESWFFVVKESTYFKHFFSCGMFGKWTAKEKMFHVILSHTVLHKHCELRIVFYICSLAQLWSNRGKVKNTKMLCGWLELGQYNFDIHHKTGVQNVAPNAFSRMCNDAPGISLLDLHKSLGNPRYVRFHLFIRQRNLPFSGDA